MSAAVSLAGNTLTAAARTSPTATVPSGTVADVAGDFATDPRGAIARLRASGWLALSIDARDGGGGAGASEVAELIMDLSAIDGSLGQIPQSHFAFLRLIRLAGSAEQWRKWGSRVAAGAFLANAQAERGSPPDAPPTVTLAPGSDGRWRLEGEKHFCTGSIYASHLAVTASIPESARGQGFSPGVHVALLAAAAPGVTIVDDWDGLGQRLTASGTIRFDGAVVEPDDIISRAPIADRATGYGAHAQLLHAAIDAGIARGAVDEATACLTAARDGGAPHDPTLPHRLGEFAIASFAAQAAVRQAAADVDGRHVTGAADTDLTVSAATSVAAARDIAARAALETSSGLLELLGSRSATATGGSDRRWRDARTHTLHDPVRRKATLIGDWLLDGTVPAPGVFS
ncbi:acyl-CoA dehydrogenase family protein [Corynebacterium hansenii]|uniref:Dibenzothiophene monooxygenase n=1 Tax=Corynebacterium hansenii TaxID=394964 RepID=A0ABV7ZME5_9CORY|nr:acyl-CoA dehydrogenase family protein [Corynebacterium hansenii]WJY98739.1 Dibenzothiophene desulfurization enzyme C [Corynebacterium hansenii]